MKIYISLWKICVRGQTLRKSQSFLKTHQNVSSIFWRRTEATLLLYRFISAMLFVIVYQQKNLFVFCWFCYIFFKHLHSVSGIHANFKQKIFETRKSKCYFVRSSFALRYISKRTPFERSFDQALEFKTKSYQAKDKTKLIWWDKDEYLRIKMALGWFFSLNYDKQTLYWWAKVGIFLLVHIENETFIIDEIDFFFSNYFLTFSVASVKHFNPSCCMIVRVRFKR